jgi:hypothetical protein
MILPFDAFLLLVFKKINPFADIKIIGYLWGCSVPGSTHK